MRTVFGDASYWIALLNPRDQWHERANSITRRLGDRLIVTSEMVLVELLNHFAEYGEMKRGEVARMVKALVANPSVEVVPQTSEQFRAAVDYYESRSDKEWGLTDCSSFQIMESRGIGEALSSDRDFAQAGFNVLLYELRDDAR